MLCLYTYCVSFCPGEGRKKIRKTPKLTRNSCLYMQKRSTMQEQKLKQISIHTLYYILSNVQVLSKSKAQVTKQLRQTFKLSLKLRLPPVHHPLHFNTAAGGFIFFNIMLLNMSDTLVKENQLFNQIKHQCAVGIPRFLVTRAVKRLTDKTTL